MIDQTLPAYLIHTKLVPPRVAPILIQRERLYAPLELHRPLTIVVAPAGYGKTMLVSQWAAHCGMRCAWLSLDASDNQLTVFVDYLLAAIERLFPGLGREIGLGSGYGITAWNEAAARKLADELDAADENFVLVLDDYHLIDDPAIHRFLTEILRFPPRNLHLVIVSRVDPPLPLAALRARAHLAEIRTSDLRFTLGEADSFLRQEMEQPVESRTLALIDESTRGWVAGLNLAALYLRNQADMTSAAAQFQAGSRFTADYLAMEVLATQPPAIQTFLLKTSILERMCPALCDALLAASPEKLPARHTLSYLERHNLFLTILDEQKLWCSYHPLFRQLLQSQLRESCPPGEVATLYDIASRWCAAQDLADEAIAYAVAAGNVAFAVEIIEQHRHQVMNAERWPELERWLHLVGRHNIETSPPLLVLEAWILHKRQDNSAIPGLLDLAEALLADPLPSSSKDYRLQGEIDTLRSQQYFRQLDGRRAFRTASQALQHSPPEHSSVRGMAWFFAAAGCFLNDGLQAALAYLQDEAGDPYLLPVAESVRIQLVKCFLYWAAGDMPNLRSTASELLTFSELRDLPESIIWARYFHGCACYQQAVLEKAEDDFRAIASCQHIAPGFVVVEGTFGLASVLQAQGNPVAACAAIQSLMEYVQQTGNVTVSSAVEAFQAYLALRQDRLNDALQWVGDSARGARHAPLTTFFAPPLAATAILIRHSTPAALAEAAQMLSNIDAVLQAAHIGRFRVEVLAQQALLYTARGQKTLALTALKSAVALAEKGDMVQLFIEAGPPLADLLDQLQLTGAQDAFVERIRQAIRRQAAPNSAPNSAPGSMPGSAPSLTAQPFPALAMIEQPRHPDLIELLTHRELEVLQLLALRLSNAEIAHELGISTGTVKQHTLNVFRKLHAENRRQAIVQAQAMGFKLETPYPF